ncbi:hypothetical protein [Sporolituus thermophilus]|uniref:Uncharacterized protein n=1 Tax=Sporolituus thermophilus DSM 23256 TaxID=1123285 RepID=A0A1G7MI42_9FIRM|nr:hypothetical protein [Sporolituus thermophilus]SDF61381.1 hypothetical protein SAMN05660235_02174 [Sporolituus thermophilus DSM 23256]
MYIEKRKNAFYLKSSRWDKDTKRVVNTSIYLASDPITAKKELSNYISDYDETKRLAAKIDELDRPKAEEVKKDVAAYLEHAETLAVLAGDRDLADAIATAAANIKKVKVKKPVDPKLLGYDMLNHK